MKGIFIIHIEVIMKYPLKSSVFCCLWQYLQRANHYEEIMICKAQIVRILKEAKSGNFGLTMDTTTL
jgi:hypothetical protein